MENKKENALKQCEKYIKDTEALIKELKLRVKSMKKAKILVENTEYNQLKTN